MATQLSLLGGGAPSLDSQLRELRRIRLDAGAWIELSSGFVRGHDQLLAELCALADWRSERRVMYEKEVDVPRLTARLELERGPAVIADIAATLERHLGAPLPHVSMAFYRDGHDSVAWHRDRVLRDLPEAAMAIVSLGEPRRFLLRPVEGGPSRRLSLGWGDLLVLGGTALRTWEHSVPKLRHAGPRLSIMFRPLAV